MTLFIYGFLFGGLWGCVLMSMRCDTLLGRQALSNAQRLKAVRIAHAQELIVAKVQAVNAERAQMLRPAALKSAMTH